MRSRLVLHAVDSHTEGMPTRVITGGIGTIPGATMNERRVVLPRAPRRHQAASDERAARPLRDERRHPPAATAGLEYGVLYIEVSGYLPMCGHGTIGVATVLVETGMVEVVEPITTIRLDTPAGLVVAEVAVEDGAARAVTLKNVPSFSAGLDRKATLPDGRTVTYDLAYGGNFYAILPLERFGLPFDQSKEEILAAGLSLMAAVNAEDEPVHPGGPVHPRLPPRPPVRARRHRPSLAPRHGDPPGWFDRSPCGTGTSARMAQLHARGELPLHTEFVNSSFIGTQFTGRLLGTTEVAGIPAVLPSFTGRAWITGTAQYLLDPTDPFPAGFVL